MAVTKILARHARLDLAINYAVNPDKTDEEVLTAYLNCDKGHACHQILATKEAKNNRDGVQYYHIIQSFKPGEITPELALKCYYRYGLHAAESIYQQYPKKDHEPVPLEEKMREFGVDAKEIKTAVLQTETLLDRMQEKESK